MLDFIAIDIINIISTYVHIPPLNKLWKIQKSYAVNNWFKKLNIQTIKVEEIEQINRIYQFYFQHYFSSKTYKWNIRGYIIGNENKNTNNVEYHMILGMNYIPLVDRIIDDCCELAALHCKNNFEIIIISSELSTFAYNCYKYKQPNWIDKINQKLIYLDPVNSYGWQTYLNVTNLINLKYPSKKILSSDEYIVSLTYKNYSEEEQFILYKYINVDENFKLFSLEFMYIIYCTNTFLFGLLLNNIGLIIQSLYEIKLLGAHDLQKIINEYCYTPTDYDSYCYTPSNNIISYFRIHITKNKIELKIQDSISFNSKNYKSFVQSFSDKFGIDLYSIFKPYLF